MLTVATVCRSGEFLYDFQYTADHVDRLHEQVSAHLRAPFRFVCLTDRPEMPDGVEIVPLVHDWPGWWSKIEMFEHDFGPTIYFDLDVTVRARIDFLTEFCDALTGYGSAVMCWTGPIPQIPAAMTDDVQRTFTRRRGQWGDQDFIESVVPKREMKKLAPMAVLDFPYRHHPHVREQYPIHNHCGPKKPWGEFGMTDDGRRMWCNPPMRKT